MRSPGLIIGSFTHLSLYFRVVHDHIGPECECVCGKRASLYYPNNIGGRGRLLKLQRENINKKKKL